MRILLVHNFYGSAAPSGENRVVLEERDLLRTAGHEVIEHFTYSATARNGSMLRMLEAGLLTPWNPGARAAVRRRILELAPDVMHVHNVFPLLSPAVLSAGAGTATACVQSLHNYRISCPTGLFFRNQSICTECLDKRSSLPAIRHGCYRSSRLASIPPAAAVQLHRQLRTYETHVDAFVAVTEFQKDLMAQAGLPQSRLHVKPHFTANGHRSVPWGYRENKVLFIGRVSSEKGLKLLVDAWALWGEAAPRLDVIGDGPELAALRATVRSAGLDQVRFLGQLPPEEALAQLSTAKLLVVPSECYEVFGLVMIEAFAAGVPVVAARLAHFPDLIEARGLGRLFTPGRAENLFDTVASLWRDEPEMIRMGAAARAEFENCYDGRANLSALERIYRHAIRVRRAAGPSPAAAPKAITTQP